MVNSPSPGAQPETTERKKYVLIGNGYPGYTPFSPGGLPTYAHLVANALLARGWQVEVICVVFRKPVPPPRTEGLLTLRCVFLPRVHWRLSRIKPIIHGLKLALAVGPSVDSSTVAVEVPHYWGIGWATILRYGKRALLRLHTSALQHATMNNEKSDPMNQSGWVWDGITARLAHRRFTHSRAHAKEMAAEIGLPVEQFTVVPHGSNLIVRSSNVQGRGRVLTIGTMEFRKGIDYFIAAAARFRAPDDPVWTAVGRAAEPWATDAVAAGVEATGAVSDERLEVLWSEARCVVMPSRYESFGLVAIEAMARGIPVVATDMEVFHEVIGPAGILVDPSDLDKLEQSVRLVLENAEVRDALIQQGYTRFSELYALPRFAERLEAAILGTADRSATIPQKTAQAD